MGCHCLQYTVTPSIDPWHHDSPEAESSIPLDFGTFYSQDKALDAERNFKTLELPLLSDVSTKAYGTVTYIRVTSSNKEILTLFVASKNRIAPLKTLTLPRLELMGALLSARLSSNIFKALKLDIPCLLWTDSKIENSKYFWRKSTNPRAGALKRICSPMSLIANLKKDELKLVAEELKLTVPDNAKVLDLKISIESSEVY
ncbi:integrase catalytic domain-containing protein [Trichonephila clavipes]|nr:integrase catalytic domain-containing protein [Trichonephila clavipes]